MSWKEHIENINEKVNKRLNMIFRIRSCSTIRAAKCIFNLHAFVQPLLDYTDTVWTNLGRSASQQLQRLQNRGPRIVLLVKSSENTFPKLNWINLEYKRKLSK